MVLRALAATRVRWSTMKMRSRSARSVVDAAA
jgi:hypothetical protein